MENHSASIELADPLVELAFAGVLATLFRRGRAFRKKIMLTSARSYRSGLHLHQWDEGKPIPLALCALIASSAATATAAAALGEANWSNAGGTQIKSDYGALAQLAAGSPPPFLVRDLAPNDALAINRRIPLSADANPPARPFRFTGDSSAYIRALACLTAATYYEAGSETGAGKHAVAQVVLNRVRHPAFANSVCGVVFEGSTRRTGCQFTFTCDGSLRRRPSNSGWRQSFFIAKAALDGAVFSPVGNATHYHANYVVPYWAISLAKNAVIGTHIFYRWPASWGRPGAFNRVYDGRELDPNLLRQAALRGPADSSPTGKLTLESDPRVELVSIVDFLANNQAGNAQESTYRHQVHSYFWSYSDHLAVQLYRQLTTEAQLSLPQLAQIIMHYSAPPELERRHGLSPELVRAAGGEGALAGLISALRDFAAHTDFQRFWQDQQPIYAQLAAQAQAQARPAAPHAARAEAFAAAPIETRRVILAPLLQDAMLAGCEQPSSGDSNAWLIVAADRLADGRFDGAPGAGVGCETLASRHSRPDQSRLPPD